MNKHAVQSGVAAQAILDHRDGVIGGRVIGNDNLKIRIILGECTRYRLADLVPLIVGDKEHRNPWQGSF